MDNYGNNQQQQLGYSSQQLLQDLQTDACLLPSTRQLKPTYGIAPTPYCTPIKSSAPWGQCVAQQQQALAADVAALTASMSALFWASLQFPSSPQATPAAAGCYNGVPSPFASPAVPAVPAATTQGPTSTYPPPGIHQAALWSTQHTGSLKSFENGMRAVPRSRE
jgi:hypothetical protein